MVGAIPISQKKMEEVLLLCIGLPGSQKSTNYQIAAAQLSIFCRFLVLYNITKCSVIRLSKVRTFSNGFYA